jgi:hypothetical protein
MKLCSMVPNMRIDREVEQVKVTAARTVMTQAAEKRISCAGLFRGLIESAASAFASGIALDERNRVLCARTDEQHIEDACQLFREAMQRQLADARQQLIADGIPHAAAH